MGSTPIFCRKEETWNKGIPCSKSFLDSKSTCERRNQRFVLKSNTLFKEFGIC